MTKKFLSHAISYMITELLDATYTSQLHSQLSHHPEVKEMRLIFQLRVPDMKEMQWIYSSGDHNYIFMKLDNQFLCFDSSNSIQVMF